MTGVDARRAAEARFGAYAAILAAVTGLGLLYTSGTRDGGSWAWFTLASVAATIGVLWAVRSALDLGAEPVELRDVDESADEPKRSRERVASESTPSQEVRSELDDVDYLMALRHEFRTPLNAVLGFSDVLLSGIDGEVNASQREDLEIIRGSGIRLRILLDSALDLSQLAAEELRLNVERVDVRELVARVAVEAGQLWSNKRAAHCSLPQEPCVADIDEARLRRSMLVLADFLATDQREAVIALSLALSKDHLAIEVSADSSNRLTLGALPTPVEILASEDPMEIRRWPVAVTSEVIALHGGSLYHGDAPSRFRIRLPVGGAP
ncbi:MAG: histidine kinase dimerization/phospho-acceptor domain-containing protein [Polyangiales bacterium]